MMNKRYWHVVVAVVFLMHGLVVETAEDPCVDFCFHGGTCVKVTDGYKCNCTKNYVGQRCEGIKRFCVIDSPCQNNAICEDLQNGGYQCFCRPGYYGNHCEMEINECDSSPCVGNATCMDMLNGYRCICPPGNTGSYCELEEDKTCEVIPCQNGGLCLYSSTSRQCECPQGFEGYHCETNIDDCKSSKCESYQVCKDLINGYSCDCPKGRSGSLCGEIVDACVSNPCLNNGTCQHEGDRYSCRCKQAYAGINCEVQIDPCEPDPCLHNGSCITNYTLTSGYSCKCTVGFVGERCEGKIPACTSLACLHGGSCLENLYSTGYTCLCGQNYTGSQCEIRLHGCLVTPCQNGGRCINNESVAVCQCMEGWTGPICDKDYNECTEVPCFNGGQCINLPGSYLCLCAPAWTGARCEVDFKECEESPCQNNGTCVEERGAPSRCICPQGTTGEYCETFVQELKGCDLQPCQNGAKCNGDGGNYTCHCLPGFEGRHCEIDTKACDLEPCLNDGTCVAQVGGYRCECRAGFSGVNCTVNDDDCVLQPCQHNGTCLDGNNTYKCMCTPGYSGMNCSEDVSECSSSPCMHGGICSEPRVGLFHCQCPLGCHGDRCEFVTMATFGGTDYVKLPSLQDLVRDLDVQRNGTRNNTPSTEDVPEGETTGQEVQLGMWFSTSIKDGTLLSTAGVTENSGNGHLLLQLVQGNLYISVKLWGITLIDSVTLRRERQVFSHHVLLTLNATHLIVTIDNCSSAEPCHVTMQLDPIGEMVDLNGPIVIGGFDHVTPYLRSKLKTGKNYVGCFGNLTVNGLEINLIPETSNGHVHQPSPGCRTSDLCAETKCKNGGRCIDLWLTSQCVCPVGFSGLLCEVQNMAEFRGRSFLHFGGFKKITILSFWISVNSSDGVLLYTLNQDRFSLYIRGGLLTFHLLVNVTDHVKVIGNVQSGDWFHILTKFDQHIYRASITDMSGNMLGSVSGDAGKPPEVHMPLYLGQLHDHPAASLWRNKTKFRQNSSFTGCVQNFTINNTTIDLQSATPSVLGNDPDLAIPGCSRESTCSMLPCQHGGTCYTGWVNHTCTCPASFGGPTCIDAQAVTLSGEGSYIKLNLNTSLVPFGDTGSIQFRTRDETVSLMFIEFFKNGVLNDTLEFSLFKSNLYVTLSTLKTNILKFSTLVSDGEWHTLDWFTSYSLLRVGLDTYDKTMNTSLFDPYLYDSMVDVYIGGKPYQPGNSDFIIGSVKGCMKNLTFNGNSIPFLDDMAESGVTAHLENIILGCHGDDMCSAQPCPGFSVCEDMWNARLCLCLEGWKGDNCTESVDDCVNSTCIHGECVDEHNNFSCKCEAGYTGNLCDVILNPCGTNPCFENGTINCTLIFPATFECLCKAGWSGQYCSQEIDRCKSSPCLNNGLCRDTKEKFQCECKGNYLGERCEQVDICSSAPCLNGGTCVSVNNNTDFVCECLQRYSGKQCQTYNFCYDNLCQNNATCISTSQGYTCQCLTEYYGVHCQFIDYCNSMPCLNSGVCQNDKDKFRCSCGELFSGIFCEIPVNRCDQNVCKNGATCFFNPSNETSEYICYCVEGFTGLHCETDINECQSNPCQNGAVCHESSQQPWNFFPGFHCECAAGFYGQLCENEKNECESMPCKNNSTCIDLINRFECKCLAGYTGTRCDQKVSGCSTVVCQNGANCVENPDKTFKCVCNNGFTGQFCEQIMSQCVNNLCKNNSTCVDEIDSYSCSCLPGFTGTICETLKDACYSQPCLNQGQCIYQGLCNCSDIIDLCDWFNESCQVEVCNKYNDCAILKMPYTCNCSNTGYDGENCGTDIDECNNSDDRCENGGICVNTIGSYYCDCSHTGFTGNRCNEDLDECARGSPCFNGGVCQNVPGSFQCSCLAGWTGKTCGELINHCISIPCQHDGRCVNTVSSFSCDCKGTGYQGKFCESDINECLGSPCLNGGTCYDETNYFRCNCSDTGYYGDRCQLKVDQCMGDPCANNGTCMDVGRTFQCICVPGFIGVLCTADVDECDTGLHKCLEQSTCQNSIGSYSCLCLDGYTGEHCDVSMGGQTDTNASNTLVLATSICVAVLIITLIVYICWYSQKSRRMKGKYKPSHVERVAGISTAIPLDKMINPRSKERLV